MAHAAGGAKGLYRNGAGANGAQARTTAFRVAERGAGGDRAGNHAPGCAHGGTAGRNPITGGALATAAYPNRCGTTCPARCHVPATDDDAAPARDWHAPSPTRGPHRPA